MGSQRHYSGDDAWIAWIFHTQWSCTLAFLILAFTHVPKAQLPQWILLVQWTHHECRDVKTLMQGSFIKNPNGECKYLQVSEKVFQFSKQIHGAPGLQYGIWNREIYLESALYVGQANIEIHSLPPNLNIASTLPSLHTHKIIKCSYVSRQACSPNHPPTPNICALLCNKKIPKLFLLCLYKNETIQNKVKNILNANGVNITMPVTPR